MASKRKLGNWLSGFANYTRYSEAPDIFHFWTGVFTIAGALRRQVWIEQRYFQWTPNFYIILVGPPGIATKSTSLAMGGDLLRQVEGIHFGPDSMTWQGLTQRLAEAQTLVPMGNTLESEMLNMACVTCAVSELGTFLRPEDTAMTDVLTDLWDGRVKPWRRDTRGAEGKVEIQNPWINVMGCTTPAWLQANYTEVMIGGGLTSRVVFVYGDAKRRLVAYPADEIDPGVFKKEEEVLVHDLRLIAELKGEYILTPEAKQWGKQWYEEHWSKRPDHMVSERYGGYIARKQTHMHKLAIVLAAADRDGLVINLDDLKMAEAMVTGMETSMNKVFQSIGAGETSRYMNEILAYVRAFETISARELWRHMLPVMGPKEFAEACDGAIKAGYMTAAQYGNEIKYTAVKE